MPKISSVFCGAVILCLLTESVSSQGSGSGIDGRLTVCIVVEGRGQYRRATKYCPLLDAEPSGVTCVYGTDRLECLRRMSKGTADFGVFSPEDLMAAQWAQLDVLVTNDLRHRASEFEHSVVAIVNRRILPDDPATSSVGSILKNTSLCHPGISINSDTLSQYLESLVTERSCDTSLTLKENRIKAMASYFRRACKAGSWVLDATRDAELKSKYPSLCAACRSSRCDSTDAYWGMAGAMSCLTAGAGDVTWVTLRDAQAYLKAIPNANDQFALLCRDGTSQPANSTNPCVWLNRPWSSVVAKRKTAAAVSQLAWSLTNSSVTDANWKGALSALLGINQAITEPLSPQKTPNDYLSTAFGFKEAYSQAGCSPPRHIKVCTASVIEQHKCDWLSEAAVVYGVDPPLQCLRRPSRDDCFRAVRAGDCDVTVASSDWLVKAKRDYSASPLLYEVTPMINKLYSVVALVRADSNINKMEDLRGKMAAFPIFDGVAWHSVVKYLVDNGRIKNCNIGNVAEYFGDSCAPTIQNERNISAETKEKFTRICNKDGKVVFGGEMEALRSLIEKRSEVAFVNVGTYNLYKQNMIPELWAQPQVAITPVCPAGQEKYCAVSWSTLGQVYAAGNVTATRRNEIVYMFERLDQLFGRNYPFRTAMMSMYGKFNHEADVLFHNSTDSLATLDFIKGHPYRNVPSNFESGLSSYEFDSCHVSAASAATPFCFAFLFTLVTSLTRWMVVV